jgi:glucose-6-phosphate dehydrogenase assembly protein OpcA
MPTIYKVLGQSAPAATTNTDLYTSPASTQTVISTITVANRAASAATFRIAVRVAGAAIATSQYIAYDVTVAANDSTNLTLGVTLAATDVVTIYASNTNLTFSLFGSQIS